MSQYMDRPNVFKVHCSLHVQFPVCDSSTVADSESRAADALLPLYVPAAAAAPLMKCSDRSETDRAAYEEPSNTRMSSWLINESWAPGGRPGGLGVGGRGLGSGSGTAAELALSCPLQLCSVNVSLSGQSSRGESTCTI